MSGSTFVSLLGIVGSFFLIVKREMVGDMIGEAEWMRKVGGVHYFIVFFAIFVFFWSLAALTGTLDILFGPIKNLIPGMGGSAQQSPESYF
jgi:hypothetical protein